jgi:hypothetical protein
MQVRIYTVLEIVEAYTNLSFTAKQKEDPLKLYDLFVSTGLYDEIINYISPEDCFEITTATKETIDNIYKYKNSIMGILEMVSNDYGNLNLEASEITDKVLNPESLNTLKSLIPLAQ